MIPTDTPRTDAEVDDARNVVMDYNCRKPSESDAPPLVVPADHARKLERELAAERALADRLAGDVKALKAVLSDLGAVGTMGDSALAAWQSARTSQ